MLYTANNNNNNTKHNIDILVPMPLIVLCGYPSCGKTIFANQLTAYLKEHANITAIGFTSSVKHLIRFE